MSYPNLTAAQQAVLDTYFGMSVGTRLSELEGMKANSSAVIWVDGSRTGTYTPDGSFYLPYTDLEDAVAAMTATRKTIFLLPGTYTLVDDLAISVNGAQIIGIGNPIIRGGVVAEGAAAVIDIDPAVATAAWSCRLETLTIQHRDGQVGVQVDNTAVAQAMTVNLRGVSIDAEGATGNAIDVDHTTANKAINLLVYGHFDVVDNGIDIVTKVAGEVFRFVGMKLLAGVTASNDNVASILEFIACEVAHEAGSEVGGHASQLLRSVFTYSRTGNTLAVADTNDFKGSQTEGIVGS